MKAWAIILALSAGHAATLCHAQPAVASAPTVGEAAATLADPNRPEAVRRAAAQYLIARAESLDAREAIERELSVPLTGSAGGLLILDALAASTDASPRLFPIIAQRLDRAAESELPRILPALAQFRTRDAARLLVTHLDPVLPEAVRTAAGRALTGLCGRSDFGTDVVAWSRWLHEAERMSDQQWRSELAQSWARRAAELEADRDRVAADLVSALRRLHLATVPAGRSAFLAGLLESPTAEVRDLGLELVGRELAASGTLGPEVGLASLALLRSESADVRATAAGLVRQLAPPGAADAVAEALSREQNPAAAGALLVAAGRWPSPRVAQAAMHWMEQPGPARERAAEALWLLYRAGELPDALQARVLTLVRDRPESAITPPVCGLVGALGDDADRARLAPLLDHDSGAIRAAAADALVWSPEHTDAILAAAAKHVDLFEIASRAVLIHRPTADGLRAVLALPRPDPDVALEATLRTASALAAPDLWEVAASQPDPVLRRQLLRDLCSQERVLSVWSEADDRAAIILGVLALSETLTAAGTPEDALSLLLSLPALSADDPASASLREAQAAALIVLGRLDEARALEPAAPTWIRALAMSLDRPHAPEVLDHIERTFAATLTPEQAGIIAEVRTVLPRPRPASETPK